MTANLAAYPNEAAAIDEIVSAGRYAAGRGWVPATSGNFSARLADGRIAITGSGIDKGRLAAGNVLLLQGDAPVPGASAETALHLARYRRDDNAGAIVHVHSATATRISRCLAAEGEVVLAGYELLKAFAGIRTHATELRIPVFANDQDVPALASAVERRLEAAPRAPGYLIAGHGLYAWGRDMGEALRHVEAFDFLFACELADMGATP
jgi:methylthioribulose-1-phosphate dehydratase